MIHLRKKSWIKKCKFKTTSYHYDCIINGFILFTYAIKIKSLKVRILTNNATLYHQWVLYHLEFVTQLDTFISRIKHPKSERKLHKTQTEHSISINRIQLYRNLTSFRIYQINFFQLCRKNSGKNSLKIVDFNEICIRRIKNYILLAL